MVSGSNALGLLLKVVRRSQRREQGRANGDALGEFGAELLVRQARSINCLSCSPPAFFKGRPCAFGNPSAIRTFLLVTSP